MNVRIRLAVLFTLVLGCIAYPAREAFAAGDSKLEQRIWSYYRDLVGDDPQRAFEAQLELEAMGAEVVPYALKKMNSMDNDAGFISAFILAEVRDPKVVDLLMDVLKNSKFKGADGGGPAIGPSAQEEKTRNIRDGFAILSLAIQLNRLSEKDPAQAAKREEAREFLRRYLRPDCDRVAFVKVCSTIGLGILVDQKSVGDFSDIALDEKESLFLRVASVITLGNFPSELSRETLEHIAMRDPEDEQNWAEIFMQKNAVLGLGNVGNEKSEPVLLNAVRNPLSPGVRTHGWIAIGELHLTGALGKLTEIVAAETEPRVQAAAAKAFYQLGDPDRCFAILQQVFANKNVSDDDTLWASEVLGSIHDDKAKDMLLKQLTSPRVNVRSQAVANLVKFAGDDAVRQRLLDIAAGKKADQETRFQALLAMTRMEINDESLAIISGCAKGDEQPKRCVNIALANRSSDNEQVAAILKKLMQDPFITVSSHACLAFATTAWRAEDAEKILQRKFDENGTKSYLVRDFCSIALNAVKTKDFALAKAQLEREADRLAAVSSGSLFSTLQTRQMLMTIQAAVKDFSDPNKKSDSSITEVSNGCTPG